MNLFVQPHADDVPWSCGGTVRRLVEEGEDCVVLTVFDKAPDTARPLSELARAIHRNWGVSDDPSPVRRAENDAALACLGVDGDSLGFQDALYRDPPSDSIAKLMSAPPPEQAWLYREVAVALREAARRHGATRVFLPLAIGTQADHVLCFAARDELRQVGCFIYHYEDFPYVAREANACRDRLAQLEGPLAPVLVDISAQIEARIEATLRYRSQTATLFRGADPGEVVRRYTAEGARHVERFWTTDPPFTNR